MTLNRLILAFAAAAAVACSTSRGSSREGGDEAMRRGAYELAILRYERAAAARPDDAGLAESVAAARERAVAVRIDRARSARDAGDLVAAENEVLAAARILPDHPEVRALRDRYGRERATVESAMKNAKAALAAGNPDAARDALVPARDLVPGFPGLFELAQRADEAARDAAVAEATAALDRGDYPAALAAARRAHDVPPASPRAARLVAQAERGVRADRLAADGARRLDAGDYRGAAAAYEDALAAHPGHVGARDGLQRARAAGARANLEAARAALAAARFEEAAERVAVARKLDPDADGLDALARAVDDARVTDHVARADAAHEAGRVALALLHRRAAAALRPDDAALTGAVDAAEREVAERLAVRIDLAPFVDAAGRRADTLGLTRAVVGRIETPHPWMEVGAPDAESPSPWRIEGELVELRDEMSRAVVRPRTVRYVARVDLVPNPERIALEQELASLEVAERIASERLDDERARYRILLWEEDRWDRRGGYRHVRDPRDRVGYSTSLIAQRTRIRRAERELERAATAVADAQIALATTPEQLERPVEATHRYEERTRIASGRAKLRLRLIGPDGAADEDEATTSFSEEDTEAPGFGPAGLAPDPLELPSPERIDERLLDRLARPGARAVERLLATVARRHLPADDATGDDALEGIARYLLAGGRGEDAARLRERLRAETGLDLAGDAIR